MDKNLLNRIAELEKKVASFENASSIPLKVENSLMGRGFINTGPMGEPPDASWSTNIGFRTEVTGFGAIVQSPAIRYLRIKGGSPGEFWFIPLYNFNEIS